ncbi:UNVERIFIED_CONTAM: Pentatricopeptide repeat-containing protein [Sesamum radiatum]|uniref:Pentatricopeptide repeat-containing protein n=1 Tax=Sesamum radiatum TaxID=300843 RepID=A0AAW2UNG8_SESRA
MIRRSGASRTEIIDSLLGTYEKCGSNLYVFDLFIRTYVQARKFREAVEAFRALKIRNVCVSINACNSLLGGLGKIGWVDLAREVYEEMVRSRMDLNSYTLNIMVNVFCKDGKMEKAKEHLMEMEKRGIFADIVTYNTMINAYCRGGISRKVSR